MLDAGSVILWKEYNPAIKIWNKLICRELPFNRFTLVTNKTELLTTKGSLKDVEIYEPVRRYNNREISKLSIVTSGLTTYKDWDETVTLVNLVRPNTLMVTGTIDRCKYYKRVEWNEKLDEYIY